MNITNLDKGANYDRDGRNLANWAFTTQPMTVSIIDNGDATIEDCTSIFDNCSSLTSVDLTQMNLENCTNCYTMFQNCYNLTTLTGFNNALLPNCNYFRGAFTRCYNLTSMPIPPNEMKNDTSYRYTYAQCYNIIGEIDGINLYNCDLTSAWSRTKINKFSNSYFENCSMSQSVVPDCDLTIENITINGCNAHYLFGINSPDAMVYTNISVENLTIKNSEVQGMFNLQTNVYRLENIRLENCRT